MTRPLVSVLTPSLNQGRFIGDCLHSVAVQTYDRIEHVVCDARSTDGTVDRLRSAGSHVRWVSESDRGQAHALNKALALAAGDVVGWVNADDAYADRRAVEAAVAAFRDPVVDVVYGHSLLVDETNRVLQFQSALPFNRRLYELSHYLVQPAVFYRRSALEHEPTFVLEALRYVMDRELLLRLSKRCRFKRIAAVIGIDRHQRARKILEPGFVVESQALHRALGLHMTTRRATCQRLFKIGLRGVGAWHMVMLRRYIDPAVALTIPALPSRLAAQLMRRRASLGFAEHS